ncbi:MAG: hypothetical protein SAK29_03355, partial [Scytonema sp. PMC 1069.18]|nr:hypothetical protein [Scytonema sp. PMC 1069.18]
MIGFTKSFYEENDEIGQLLKDVNAVLRKPNTSIIQRYAGISEIARFTKNWQSVGVLTVGLFDTHPQVRQLAASTLKSSYNLGETSDLVLKLLENNGENLKDAIEAKDEQNFSQLINKMEQLRRKRSSSGMTKVDYGSQHLLIILRELGIWIRQIQVEVDNTQPHALKQLLEKDDNSQSLKLIRKCLESQDVFCRRRAILLIGELDLDVGIGKSAFDLILENIDTPDNCNEYLVTWDGIQALTAIVQQNSSLRSVFFKKICDFFQSRTYDVDADLKEEHSFHTRKHCVEALGNLCYYEELNKLLKTKYTNNKKLLDMMSPGSLRAESSLKEAFVKAFAQIFYQGSNGETQELTLRQKKILNKIISWVNSSNRYVRQVVNTFFNELPSAYHGLVRKYLYQSAEHNYKRVHELLLKLHQQSLNEGNHTHPQQKLAQLLAKRRDIATVLGVVFTRIVQLSQSLSGKNFQKNIREKAQQEKEGLLSDGKEVAGILLKSCLQGMNHTDGQQLELKNLKIALREVLWTFYELGASMPDAPSLTLEQIAGLRYLEEDDSCRLVLTLFRVRNSGELLPEQLKHLEQIASGDDNELVRVCVEIEQQIKTKGRHFSLSTRAVQYIPEQLGKSQGIHHQLALRFIPVLAEMETKEATHLIKSLLESKDDSFKLLIIQLREALCEYQCYHLRDELVQMLLQDLTRRYKNRENLRLDYLNLLRAGKYQRKKTEDTKLQFPQEDKLTQRVARGIQDIQKNFSKLELPVLFPTETQREQVDYCVAGSESMSLQSVNTLLYKVEAQEMGEQIVKVYLHHFKENNAWVFLERALTDREIIEIIASRKKTDNPIEEIDYFILGKVERVADDNGVYVNIGLHQYKSIFVSKAQIIDEQDEQEINWLQYVRELLGSIIKFRIRVTINTNTHQMTELELTHKEFWVDPLENPKTNITVQGHFVSIDNTNDKIPSAIFQVKGINKTLKVLLPELSWRKDKDWVNNWRLEFHKHETEEFEITYNKDKKQWSLRENPPKDEYFFQLLYDSQSQKSCELVYVKKQKEGYVFEIEPGKLCYVPAERLLEITSEGNTQEYNFFFSRNNIKQGTILKEVIFTDKTNISSKTEVILTVKESQIIPALEDILPEGMRIFGILQDLEDVEEKTLAKKTISLPIQKQSIINRKGKLDTSSHQEQPPGHNISKYIIEIEQLPAHIKIGDEVSGQILKVYEYEKRIALKYVEVPIDGLEVGQSYQCKVLHTPKPEDSRLLLRHGNIVGRLYERNMTCGHMSVLSNYRQGLNLIARVLEKQEARPRQAILQVNEQILAQLGLEQEDSNGGKVIANNQGIVTFEGKDYKPVQFPLHELKFEGDSRNVSIYEGDRIYFTKVSLNKVEVTVETARIIFSLKPRIDEKWSNWQEVLKIDNSYKCIYVDFKRKNYLLEYHPEKGSPQPVFFALPQNCTEGISKFTPHTGDYLTLRCLSDEIVRLEKFEPGPLHFAANPQKFKDNQHWSWMTHPLLSINQNKILISCKIIDTNYQHGMRLELQRLRLENYGIQNLHLVNGIQAFLRLKDMNLEEQQRFLKGHFKESDSIDVILAQPPEIQQNKLWLTVESSTYIEKTTENQDIELLRNKIKKIRESWLKKGKSFIVKGTIGNYVKSEAAFQVILDELADYHQDNYCWLPVEHISASLVHSYNSLEDFGNERRKQFTIIDVYPDDDYPELEVSLIQNYPTKDIEEAREEFDWSDGTILKQATFLGTSIQRNMDVLEEGQTSKITITEIISVEIKPGVLIDVSVEKFLVEGLGYKSGGEEFGLQRGDQLTLKVNKNKQENSFTLDVIKYTRAQFNLLFNKRKVVYGEIDNKSVGDRIKLKIQGYSKVQCFLAPEYSKDIKNLLKRKRILFKVTDSPQNIQDNSDLIYGSQLYFKPIEKQDLRAGDRLRVTYKDIVG